MTFLSFLYLFTNYKIFKSLNFFLFLPSKTFLCVWVGGRRTKLSCNFLSLIPRLGHFVIRNENCMEWCMWQRHEPQNVSCGTCGDHTSHKMYGVAHVATTQPYEKIAKIWKFHVVMWWPQEPQNTWCGICGDHTATK